MNTKFSLHRLLLLALPLFVTLLPSCSETKNNYILYNNDTGKDIELFYTSDISNPTNSIRKVPSRTECYVYDIDVKDGVAKIVLKDNYAQTSSDVIKYYVDNDYIFRHKTKIKYGFLWYTAEEVSNKSALILYDLADELQDSPLHYKCSPVWVTLLLVICILIFAVLIGFASKIEGDTRWNHKFIIPTLFVFLLIVGLEFLNYIILGDGYVDYLKWGWLYSNDWKWLWDIILFILRLLLTIVLVVAIAVLPPAMGHLLVHHTKAKDDKVSLVMNLAIALVAYVGTALAYFSESDEVILVIAIIIGAASLFNAIWGLCKGNKWAICFILFPLFYLITVESLFKLLGALISMLIIVGIVCVICIFSFLGSISPKGRSRGRSVKTIGGEEVEEVNSCDGFSHVYQSKSTGRKWGSNNGTDFTPL